MASVARSHRKAYGSHRTMSPAQKAVNVARSIAARQAENRSWSWAEYGLDDNTGQRALVLKALKVVLA